MATACCPVGSGSQYGPLSVATGAAVVVGAGIALRTGGATSTGAWTAVAGSRTSVSQVAPSAQKTAANEARTPTSMALSRCP